MNGTDFREERTVLGFTQKELAMQLDFSVQQVSNYETGRVPIPKVVTLALEHLLLRKDGLKKTKMTLLEERFIRQFVEKARAGIPAVFLVILFGSKARGEATRVSDIDLLFLIEGNKAKARKRIYETLFELDPVNRFRISPVVYSLKDYRKNQALQSPFVEAVSREGILL